MNQKSPGQLAYEEDVRRCPTYHDSSPRRPWHEIDAVAQWSWERDPRPREFTHRKLGAAA